MTKDILNVEDQIVVFAGHIIIPMKEGPFCFLMEHK